MELFANSHIIQQYIHLNYKKRLILIIGLIIKNSMKTLYFNKESN